MSTNNILILCEDKADLAALTNTFEYSDSFKVIVAKKGADFYKTIEKKVLEMIIVDLPFSNISNIDLIKEIKRKYRTQKVLVVTSDRRKTLQLILSGAVDIIFKPFDKFDLLHHIEDLIQDKRSSKRFELKECDIEIILLNQDGVRIKGSINNICMDGVLIEFDEVQRAKTFFEANKTVDVMFQPSNSEPLVKMFRGKVIRIYQGKDQKGKMAIYLALERNTTILDDFTTYFKMNLGTI